MPTQTLVRTEFAAAIAQIVSDRNITAQAVLNAIKQALLSAYKKQYELEVDDERYYYWATVDENNGESKIFRAPVLKRNEETLEIIDWDEQREEDVTPAGFGRIAAQTAKYVIVQKIREAERDRILTDFSQKIGTVVVAQVLRMEQRSVIVDLGGQAQGFMPPEEQMRGEFYRLNSRVAVFIKEIRETYKGQRIVVSRAVKELVTGLFAKEVPEVGSGAVEIVSIAREAGVRTKLAVRSTQEGIDPVGACVGQRGVRVQQIIQELNNEKIDIIPFSDNDELYLRAALSPAEQLLIVFNEKKNKAVVTVPADQVSLAIGRGGQNVRLAAKLTGWQIQVVSDGAVRQDVTGAEEFEIDLIEGLTAEARQFLIERKFTTTADLIRFRDKWVDESVLGESQVALIDAYLAAQEKAEALRQEQQAALVGAAGAPAAKQEEVA